MERLMPSTAWYSLSTHKAYCITLCCFCLENRGLKQICFTRDIWLANQSWQCFCNSHCKGFADILSLGTQCRGHMAVCTLPVCRPRPNTSVMIARAIQNQSHGTQPMMAMRTVYSSPFKGYSWQSSEVCKYWPGKVRSSAQHNSGVVQHDVYFPVMRRPRSYQQDVKYAYCMLCINRLISLIFALIY